VRTFWWASALDSADFALQRIDSLLGVAAGTAACGARNAGDFWLATALGYRARQREEHGHAYGAAKGREGDAPTSIVACRGADSSCADCYLGIGRIRPTGWRAPARSPDSLRASSAWEAETRNGGFGTCGARRMTAIWPQVESTWVLARRG